MAGPNDTMSTSSSTTTTTTPPANDAKHPTFEEQLESFDFRGDAIDMALRKLLAKAHLPKEAQQIDRAMEDFAKRYHECNPDLADSPDAAYAVAFSLLLLHTDAHNKNVRQKMNKETFVMRTRIIEGGEDVPVEILDIMYDNIVSTEFTYAAEDEDPSKPRSSSSWFGRLAKSDSSHALSSANTIEDLYPKLTQLMPPENSFCYKRTLRPIQLTDTHMAFHHAKPLNLGGVRGRHTHDGSNTYTIRVAKAAILERKYDMLPGGKKATARGWRPFGVILSGSQIIFFGDVLAFDTWLMQEERPFQFPTVSTSTFDSPSFTSSIYSTHSLSNSIAPIPGHPNLLRPVQIISLQDAVCIYDESYTKYPHVFRLMTGDGQIFLMRAKSSGDLDDWMTKINYACTTKSTNVRLRPSRRREEKAKSKVLELSRKMIELERLLEKDLQLRRNLMVLTPLQKASKDRILYFAEITGKRIYAKRLEMQRLECYREFLEVAFNEPVPRKLSAPLLSRAMVPQHLLSAHRSATSPAISTIPPSPMSYDDDQVMWSEKSPSSSTEMLKPADDAKSARRSSCPQIPPFPFAMEELPTTATTTTTTTTTDKHKDKAVAFDVPSSADAEHKTSKWMRRRSSSNPVKPDKMGRERSSSEASSVRDDDELTIVNVVATDEEKQPPVD